VHSSPRRVSPRSSAPDPVIVLLGGHDFWSNGIHLNTIEASTNPAMESWRNINAIDDLIFEILNTMSISSSPGCAATPGQAARCWRSQRTTSMRDLASSSTPLPEHG